MPGLTLTPPPALPTLLQGESRAPDEPIKVELAKGLDAPSEPPSCPSPPPPPGLGHADYFEDEDVDDDEDDEGLEGDDGADEEVPPGLAGEEAPWMPDAAQWWGMAFAQASFYYHQVHMFGAYAAAAAAAATTSPDPSAPRRVAGGGRTQQPPRPVLSLADSLPEPEEPVLAIPPSGFRPRSFSSSHSEDTPAVSVGDAEASVAKAVILPRLDSTATTATLGSELSAITPTVSAAVSSAGSAEHGSGACKPCAFLHTKGCVNGVTCTFCHLCGPDEIKRRRKAKFAMLREAKQRENGEKAQAAAQQEDVEEA